MIASELLPRQHLLMHEGSTTVATKLRQAYLDVLSGHRQSSRMALLAPDTAPSPSLDVSRRRRRLASSALEAGRRSSRASFIPPNLLQCRPPLAPLRRPPPPPGCRCSINQNWQHRCFEGDRSQRGIVYEEAAELARG